MVNSESHSLGTRPSHAEGLVPRLAPTQMDAFNGQSGSEIPLNSVDSWVAEQRGNALGGVVIRLTDENNQDG